MRAADGRTAALNTVVAPVMYCSPILVESFFRASQGALRATLRGVLRTPRPLIAPTRLEVAVIEVEVAQLELLCSADKIM